MTPLTRFFRPPGPGRPVGQSREHLAGMLPSEMVEDLEGLIGEVDRVPSVEEQMVRRRRSHQGRHLFGFGALPRRRGQNAF